MTDYPSLVEQGKNLMNFASKIAQNKGPLFVSDEIKQQRMNICKECDEYDETQIRCKKCGCFLLQKASFSLDSCPLNKWSSVLNSEKQNDDNVVPASLNKPTLPRKPSPNEIYTWNDISWTWNGKMWDINITNQTEEI
jgi:hypothetical protein